MRFVAVLLLAVGAWGQSADRVHDGNYWRTLSHDFKIAYVLGYSDGECAGEMRVWTALPADYALHSGIATSVFPKGVPYAEECLIAKGKVTYGQIADAISQFYSNANNRLILVDWAWEYVKADIEGKPLPEKKIKGWRAAAAGTPLSPR